MLVDLVSALSERWLKSSSPASLSHDTYPNSSQTIMHKVQFPSVYGSLLMRGNNLPVMVDNNLVAVDERNDRLAAQPQLS